MRTNTRRGRRALVLLVVLTVAVSLSERAQAQQGGLFPLAPIRRERPACQNEDPVYKLYKQKYFGYHPTIWNQFPEGWGAPSKYAPDKAKAYAEVPLGGPQDRGDGEAPPEDEMGGPGLGGARPLPNLPGGRSPFETDSQAPGVNPAPRGNPSPPAAPPGGRSPFDDLNQGAASPARRGARSRAVAPPPGGDGPELMAPAATLEADPRARATTAEPEDGPAAMGGNEALVDIDDLDAPRPGNAGPVFDPPPAPATVPTAAPNPDADVNPPRAPRRGLISSLFGGLGMNWLRR